MVHLYSLPDSDPPYYDERISRWEYAPGRWRVEIRRYASDADEDGWIHEWATFGESRASYLSQVFVDNYKRKLIG